MMKAHTLTHLLNRLKNEIVFSAALLITFLMSFAAPPDLAAIDWKVLLILAGLMLICQALEKYFLLERLAGFFLSRSGNLRQLSQIMVLVTAVLGMLITNDVALFTVVPLTLSIAARGGFNSRDIIILETMAANIGSSLTPFGNPQNLFLFEYYGFSAAGFMGTTAPLVAAGLMIILTMTLRIPALPLPVQPVRSLPEYRVKNGLHMALFLLVLLSVIHLMDWRPVIAAVFLIFLLTERDLLIRLDWFLLGTFICFFLITGTLSRMPALTSLASRLMAGPEKVFLAGALLSQGISNVPAALLLAPFTTFRDTLLLGVSAGGLGTLVASMANLISYKLYLRQYRDTGYTLRFHLFNLAALVILLLACIACFSLGDI